MSTSIWTDSIRLPHFPSLNQNLSTEICVVGGGLGGIATAYLLQKSGKQVCVLEADTVGSGQTGRTTAHFVNALDDRYYKLEHDHGTRGMQLAAESHTAALNAVEAIVQNESIECDFKRVPGYLFLAPGDRESLLQKELKAAHRAGLKTVRATDNIPELPFKSGPALLFPDQIQLHPLKFLHGLTEAFLKAGGKIYAQTPVESLRGGPQAHAVTQTGFLISCQALVVATNSPINDLFAIHTKQAAYRTYVVGGPIPKGSMPECLLWDTLDPYHYIRTQPDPFDSRSDILIIGGEDHKTGQQDHPEEAYTRLEKWARTRFPMLKTFTTRWSGQVMEPTDGLAFLGHNPFDRNNVYVITGDSGNGMTHCMIGALLIRDQIEGKPNPWEVLYEPSRKNLMAIKDFIKENANVAVQYGDWLKKGEVEDTDEIAPGEGALVRDGTELVAAYVDPSGVLSTVSAVCPHLGGIVHWNSAEKTWDCPCHGSRFDAYGNVIEGPACSNLKQLTPGEAIPDPST